MANQSYDITTLVFFKLDIISKYRTRAMANRGFNNFFIFFMSGYYCREVINRMRSLLLWIFFSRCYHYDDP